MSARASTLSNGSGKVPVDLLVSDQNSIHLSNRDSVTNQDQIVEFRQILRSHLTARIHKNASYSMRAFARDLELPPHRLSEVLNGHQGISRQVAVRIVEKLEMSPDDAEHFCDLVDAVHSRSASQREAAKRRIEAKSKYQETYNSIELDQFRIISEWYHLAILELVNVKGFKGEINWIAKKLGVSLPETHAAVERLLRLKLLGRDSSHNLVAIHQVNETQQRETPSEFVRSFHRRVIGKSIEALERQAVSKREFSTLFVSLKADDVPKAKQKIRDFWRGFCQEFNSTSDADAVYSLTTQFFQLTVDGGADA